MKRPPGTGTIDRTPDGRFRPRLPRHMGRGYLDVCETEGEAQALLAVAIEAPPAQLITLAEWGEGWIDHRKAQGYRSTAHERRRWRRLVTGSPLGERPLVRVTRLDVQAWVDALPYSRKTVSNALGLVRGGLQHAVRRKKLPADPSAGVLLPPGSSAPSWDWLRAREVEALIGQCEVPKQRAVFTAAIYTGMRAGELWGLRWEDVDTEQGVIRVQQAVAEDGTIGPTKTGRARELPLLHPVKAALDDWRPHCPERNRLGLVFPGRYGGPHARGHRAGLYDLLDRSEVRRVRFHDLRHTCASHLIQGTWAPWIVARPLRLEEVQQWLGHSTRVMTERYAHLAPDGLRGLRVDCEGPEGPGTAGDPKGIRNPVTGPSGPLPERLVAEIVQLVGQADRYVDAVAAGDPRAHQVGLEVAFAAQRLAAHVLAPVEESGNG